MYLIQFLDEARRDIRRLDRSVIQRLNRKLKWLAENADAANPEWLRGNLAGLARIREGNYRIVYEVIQDEGVILVHFIGHRSEVYKR